MQIKLQKWGNSYGIRIPSTMLKALNINVSSDRITLEQQDDKIVLSKSKSKKISLKERFENYKGNNLAKEFSWDDPIGEEIW